MNVMKSTRKEAVLSSGTKGRKGFALIFVLLIAAAMMIPILMLLSSIAPRRTNVEGEAISDRTLALSDSTVDNILNQVNTFPFNVTGTSLIVGYQEDVDGNVINEGTLDASSLLAQTSVVYYYVSLLNGGVVPDVPGMADTAAIAAFNAACAEIAGNVSTYVYNLNTQEYYVLWDSTNIASVALVGPNGDIATGTLKNVSSGATTTFSALDSNYKTDNIWVEIDTNTKYVADQWNITVTSYLLSKPDIKRTVKALASRGTPTSPPPSSLADGSWFTHELVPHTIPGHNFADYAGLYHTKVYFGKLETTTGPIRSDSDLYMGGWAKDPVFAGGYYDSSLPPQWISYHVYDYAVDDSNSNNHDGQFGPDSQSLTWAKNHGYATDGYPAATWANVDTALYGSNNVRNQTDLSGGMQDKANGDYYINGDATVVFNANETVTIKIGAAAPYTLPMPLNGAIFVEGTATVSGTVKGQCSVGASKINIGGNIIYATPPRTDRNAPIPANPDLLGLISHGDITITTSTFNLNYHLQIDAAMISGSGNFGIASDAPSHTIDPTGTFTGTWNGCQACYATDNAPAVNLGGNQIRGYEVQHTNYDWNLRDYGVPPFYPVTTSTGESQDLIDQYPVVTDSTIMAVLTGLSKDDLTLTGDSTYPYSYVYNGTTYYYGGTFNWYATATMSKSALYRISWKEQIGTPVTP
jgi:hypothetical protein